MPTCIPQNKNKTDCWTHACGSSICYTSICYGQILVFPFELMNLIIMIGEGANSTMQRVFLQSYQHILAGGKSTIEGKNGYAKTGIVDFPRGKLAIQSYFRGEILQYSHFSGGKFYYGKIIVIFPGGKTTRGEKLLSDRTHYFIFMWNFRKNWSNCTDRHPPPSHYLSPLSKFLDLPMHDTTILYMPYRYTCTLHQHTMDFTEHEITFPLKVYSLQILQYVTTNEMRIMTPTCSA